MGAFARLRDKRFNGYLAYRVPHELDSVVDAAVSAYRSGSEDARRQLTRELNPRVAAVLSVYGERMAVLAVRTRSVEPLRPGRAAGMTPESVRAAVAACGCGS